MSLIGAGVAAAAPRPRVEPNVPVTATNLSVLRAQNSPAVAVDPTESSFLALANRIDGPTQFDCALAVSGDSGRSWEPALPVPALPAGVDHCYAPEVAFDRTGLLYYLFVGLQGAGNKPTGAFLTTSRDRGRSFGAPRRVLGPDRFMVRMAIDQRRGPRGRMYMAWVEPGSEPALGGFTAAPNRMLATHSDDGGRTFVAPVQVSDPTRTRVVAPALVLAPDGAVHVAYYDLQDDIRDYQGLEGPVWDGTWSLLVATSDDGGARFRTSVVDDRIAPAERVILVLTMPPPSLAAGAEGRLYVAWADARNGDADVLLSRLDPGARQWTPPQRVNDDSRASGRKQYLPRVSVAPRGRVDVIFYDRRDDPADQRANVYYTYSQDGGRQFAPNVRLTSEGSFWESGVSYPIPSARGLTDFGSRLALWSARDRVVAAWTDTRMTRRGSSTQDIFSTRIFFPTPARQALSPVIVAAVVLAVILMAIGVVALRHRSKGTRRGTPVAGA